MVIVESPERPSTAGKQLGCQLVEMISKETSDVRAGGPPAVTKNEKSSSLFKTNCLVGRRREHRSIQLVILIILYILYIYFLKWLQNYLRKTPCVHFFGADCNILSITIILYNMILMVDCVVGVDTE